MDWSNERYVRLYLRDTPEWALLSWEARGFFCLLLRAVDRAGLLDMGRSGHKALAALLRVPLEVVDRAVPELLQDGCIQVHGEQILIPNYIEAQEAKQSDRVRQQESRATRRDRVRAGLEPAQREVVIYFIQSEHGGAIKIGRTEDLAKRLLQLQGGRPDKIIVLAAAPGTPDDEARLHRRFAQYREKGEWFTPVEELMVMVKDVAARGSLAFTVTPCDRIRDVTCHEPRPVTLAEPSLAEPSLAVEDLPCAARTGDTHQLPVHEPAEPDATSEHASHDADVAPGAAIDASPTPPPPPALKKRQRGSQAPTPATEELRAAWNELTTDPLPRWRESGAHVGLALAALRRRPLEQWREVFRLANQSAFLRGENDRGWRADIAFLLRAGGTNGEPAQRILDGAFRSSGAAGAMGRQRTGRAEYSTEWDGKPF